MPEAISSVEGSKYNQTSFKGGMNLLLDDSQLSTEQYRIGFNLTNRRGPLDPVLASRFDVHAPAGLKQEMVTFGAYEVLFVAGAAYYKHFTSTGWKLIAGFSMSPTAPRYWTCAIPVSTTNYNRIAATGNTFTGADPAGQIEQGFITGTATGDVDGLLIQDNINQPQFIFLDGTGKPACRTTQKFDQWSITFTDANNTDVAPGGDLREYVPIGNCMTWEDGTLYMVSQDFRKIYRSVSGRPLDFVVAISNELATGAPFKQTALGDADSTAYSVGLSPITCIRPLSSGGIFVSASGSNYAVTKNKTPNAPTIFGEYTFIKTFLFNSICLSDRAIIDTIGDTRFISQIGVRSFNAIAQTQNQGQNLPFSSTIQSIFGTDTDPILQSSDAAAAILFNDYELYAINTIIGYAIAKFDTVNNCWTSFDISQVDGVGIKILAKIETPINILYAVTTDDKVYRLYAGPEQATASFRTIGICANILEGGVNIKVPSPDNEIVPEIVRVILNNITDDCICNFTPYVNNRLSSVSTIEKTITYEDPPFPSEEPNSLPDVDTQLMNVMFNCSDCNQGWKMYGVFEWTGGSFTQFSVQMQDIKPMNPLTSQELTQ